MTRRRLAFVVVLAAATAPSSTDETCPETFDRKLGDDVRVTATDLDLESTWVPSYSIRFSVNGRAGGGSVFILQRREAPRCHLPLDARLELGREALRTRSCRAS